MATTAMSNAGSIAEFKLSARFPLAICIFIQENNKHKNGSLMSVLN